MPEERPLWESRPHLRFYLLNPFFVFYILLLVYITNFLSAQAFKALAGQGTEPHLAPAVEAALIFGFIAIILATSGIPIVMLVMRLRTTRYAITNKRAMIVRPFSKQPVVWTALSNETTVTTHPRIFGAVSIGKRAGFRFQGRDANERLWGESKLVEFRGIRDPKHLTARLLAVRGAACNNANTNTL